MNYLSKIELDLCYLVWIDIYNVNFSYFRTIFQSLIWLDFQRNSFPLERNPFPLERIRWTGVYKESVVLQRGLQFFLLYRIDVGLLGRGDGFNLLFNLEL